MYAKLSLGISDNREDLEITEFPSIIIEGEDVAEVKSKIRKILNIVFQGHKNLADVSEGITVSLGSLEFDGGEHEREKAGDPEQRELG